MTTEAFDLGCAILQSPVCLLSGANGAETGPCGIFANRGYLSQLKEPAIFLVNPMWTYYATWFRNRVFKALHEVRKEFPQHKFVLFVNDQRELALLDELPSDIERYVCGEIAATEIELYTKPASANIEIKYDAVYVARLQSYKRIELVSKLNSLALISRGITLAEATELKSRMPNVHILNVEGEQTRDMKAHEVAAFLPNCACGLILSSSEGQNRATTEYLLSGLPVISTPSVGGRDRLLTPENSIIVDATAAAVRRGVEFIRSSDFSCARIKEEAINAVIRERKWLASIVSHLIGEWGFKEVDYSELQIPHHGSSSSRLISAFPVERIASSTTT